jgi:hypothetical protein
MITFQEFLDKWNGKPCEMGGSANAMNQCVDLANAWIAECGEPIVLWTNAQDFPSKISKNFKYILNTPTGIPKQGDIIVWSSPDKIGHIAICSSATATKFVSFDQNWPVGSLCKLVNHVYTGTYKVIGWLRYEKQIDYPTMVAEKDKQIQTLQAKVLDLDKFVKDLTDRVTALESNIQADLGLIEDWQKKTETANSKVSALNQTLQDMTDEKNKYKGYYETALKDQINKFTGWQLIRLGIKKLSISKSK